MKKHLRAVVVGAIVAMVALGTALAGIVVLPPPSVPESPASGPSAGKVAEAAGLQTSANAGLQELKPTDVPRVAAAKVSVPKGGRTPEGTFLVGAARASLSPAPTKFGGQTWQRSGCTSIEDGNLDQDHALPDIDPSDPNSSLDDIRSWPATGPDCIYLGGFGIGPHRYAKSVGSGGVWVRAMAISNGEKTLAYAVADTVGWFARYDPTICDDCGIRDVRERLASDLGTDIGDIVIGSTHTHAGADTYGGWGGIPKWYRNQIRDSAIAAVKQAVLNLQPATISAGEAQLRDRNNERRDLYYSTVDTAAPWLQAKTLPTTQNNCGTETTLAPAASAETNSVSEAARSRRPRRRSPTPKPAPTASPTATATPTPTASPIATPACTPTPVPGEVVATMAAFAAHPTMVGEPLLHADWPGAAARRFESTYGGVGLMFEGGLGNASVSGIGPSGAPEQVQAENTGVAIANDIARSVPGVQPLGSNDLRASVQDISHPVDTNLGIVTLASVGFFDREFLPTGPGADAPGVYHWSRSGELSTHEGSVPRPEPRIVRGCTSAGPSLRTTVGAHRIGSVLVAFTPGEIFSNIAEVIKERADNNSVAMVLGQSNDALGYIIQSFEFDTQANAVTHYGTQTGEYEEVFAVDRCFGDHVLETVLESTGALGFGR